MKRTIFFVLMIMTVGFAIYANVLHGEFVSDDHLFILDNASIRNIGDSKSIWNFFSSRFLTGFSLAFNYWVGQYNVFGYHLFNIIVHILNSLLVFILFPLIFKTPYLKDAFKPGKVESMAFFSALLFLCHPVQTQAVSYIYQRSVLMATTFYLLTMIFYIRGRLGYKQINFLGAYLSMMIGCLTREIIVTVPLMLFIFEIFFFESWRKPERRKLYRLLPFSLTIGFLIFLSLHNPPDSILQTKIIIFSPHAEWNYLFTEVNVLRTYLRLLILPVNLQHNYLYPISQGFFEVPTFFSFCLLMSLLTLAVFLYRRNRLISFCILWFFISVSVEATAVVFGYRGIIYEHWLYLTVVGFSLFFVYAIYQIIQNKIVVQKVLFVTILTFCFMTVQRNKVWLNQIVFWQDAVRKGPTSILHHAKLAQAYQRRGFMDKAEEHFKKAVKVKPEQTNAYFILAKFYIEQNKYQEAIAQFDKILNISPGEPVAHRSIGRVYFLTESYDLALEHLKKAVELTPDEPTTYLYMSDLYDKWGNFSEAQRYIQLAIQQRPYFLEAHKKLGNLFLSMERYADALKIYRNILLINPEYGSVYNTLGISYLKLNQKSKAEQYFLKALEFSPQSKKVRLNLEKFYREIGDTKKSEYYAKESHHSTETLGEK